MRKLFLVLLFGLFFAFNYSKAETSTEFRNRCDSYGGQVQYIPIEYKGCRGVQLICALTSGNNVALNYGPILPANSQYCFVLNAENLSDPDFWKAIDLQSIAHLTNHGYYPGNCSDTSNVSSSNIYTYFQFTRRLCNKYVYNSYSNENSLELCDGVTALCFTKFSVCKDENGILMVVKLFSNNAGTEECSTNINLTMHPTLSPVIFESDCFSVGCY
ncbi:MAG: hypothetical protein NTW25_01765 [Candidatus Kapabacteria bacterium]|nr:hypothetical protein [Candidatus Kapabacteria bacterium]